MSRKEPENLQEVLQVLARKLPAFDTDDDEKDIVHRYPSILPSTGCIARGSQKEVQSFKELEGV